MIRFVDEDGANAQSLGELCVQALSAEAAEKFRRER